MLPNLRSVVGQCYRRSIGFNQAARNFSSSAPGSRDERKAVRRAVGSVLFVCVATGAGYGLGALVLGGSAAEVDEQARIEDKEQEMLHQLLDELVSSDVAAAELKSRAA